MPCPLRILHNKVNAGNKSIRVDPEAFAPPGNRISSRLVATIGVHMADKRAPVCQQCAWRIGDVLSGHPDRAIGRSHSGGVVAPAASAGAAKGGIAGEAIIWASARP